MNFVLMVLYFAVLLCGGIAIHDAWCVVRDWRAGCFRLEEERPDEERR